MPDDVTGPGASASPSPRLLVIDADDRTRGSIAGILGIRHRYEVIGSAGHVAAALDLVAEHHPDIVVIDPRLPDLPDGIALIRAIRSVHPAARILALGWTPGLEQDALVAGADGFIRKTLKPGDLSGAIERCRSSRSAPAAAPSPRPAPTAGRPRNPQE